MVEENEVFVLYSTLHRIAKSTRETNRKSSGLVNVKVDDDYDG